MNQLSFEFSSRPRWADNIAVFDTETTGLDLREARIVTACVVEIGPDGNVVGDNVEWLADPAIEIPEAAASVHGVTTEFARANGRPAAEVVAELLAALRGFMERGIPVVAYNAPYDFTILKYEALRHGLEPIAEPFPVLDPLVIDKAVDRYRKGKRRLENAAEVYGVALDDAHNATADAIAAGRVMQAIATRFADKLPADVAELHRLQEGWANQQAESFAQWLREKGETATAELGWPVKNI